MQNWFLKLLCRHKSQVSIALEHFEGIAADAKIFIVGGIECTMFIQLFDEMSIASSDIQHLSEPAERTCPHEITLKVFRFANSRYILF